MSEKYDVVIIGAGIGGLTCGCYLAKAGLKVLIVEQHNKPGGYCTSFERKGYKFDVGVHYLGGVKNGALSRIFKELDIVSDLRCKQFDPTDKLVMPHNTIYIRADINDTIHEFKKAFPQDKYNIQKFFNFVLNHDFLRIYSITKDMNFRKLLNNFFSNVELKSILEALLGVGNVGLPANKASAISSILLFREFLSDPGWYPKGGMQSLPDILAKVITDNNGEVMLSTKVTRILVNRSKVEGVVLGDGTKIIARNVVSNVDATQTYKDLLDIKTRQKTFTNKLRISPSFFSVYLGLKNDFYKEIDGPATIWYFSTYNISNCYGNLERILDPDKKIQFLLCVFPYLHDKSAFNKPTMELLIPAPFKTVNLWRRYRQCLMDRLIERAESMIPSLSSHIEIKINATPHTYFRYTLNKSGAAYGWASTPYIIQRSVFPTQTSIQGLFLAGHWSTGGLSHGGIPQVSAIGRKAARLIIEGSGLEWKYKPSVIL